MTNYAKIYDDAIAHFGLVSTTRAKALGVSALQLLKLARSGRLERVGCGLYRIAAALPFEGDAPAYALAVEDAGAFAVTLECVPSELAAEITAALKIVTVGIGAGPVCDAQWLVMHDLLGLNEGSVPSFVKQYANLAADAKQAFSKYVEEVASGRFPA